MLKVRERWGQTRLACLAQQASQQENDGAIAAALVYAQRIASDNPALEHAHRRLMRLHWPRRRAPASGLHGGGSPAAMKQAIWRNCPVGSKADLVERLLDRGVLHQETRDEMRAITRNASRADAATPVARSPGRR